jgi:hypothetical protein
MGAAQKAIGRSRGRPMTWKAPMRCCPAQTVIADKAYDAQGRVIEPLQKVDKAVVIPSIDTRRHLRDYGRYPYKARHLIENFFAKL